MEILKFKVTLLSDVIISESPATQGRHRGLDFIPGNNFLGIAASQLYKNEDEHTYLLFHSGHVRFGDANPGYNDIRSHRTPACFFKPKYPDRLPAGTDSQARFVHHKIANFAMIRESQPKQCRSGFMAFDGDIAYEIDLSRNYVIKSAYDSKKRRAEDEKLFGYESLAKGAVLYFGVELDGGAAGCKKEISDALSGLRHIGRSRSAQFGLVRIEPFDYRDTYESLPEDNYVVVYADSRLCFFDEEGKPTMFPTAEQLGVKGGEIDLSKSQIRTFQYTPWNYKRQAFGNERCGIEKGSVIIVKGTTGKEEAYVGAYQNEGFGKVIYNPSFLKADSDGISKLTFKELKDEGCHDDNDDDWTARFSDTSLLSYLCSKKAQQTEEKYTYSIVDDFVNTRKDLFKDITASQWGTIRGIALSAEKDEGIINLIKTYLSKGVAKGKWDERGRREVLVRFLDQNSSQASVRDLVINLTSEMAKDKNKQEENDR